MDIQRAKELLTVLADGIDPLTGEVLPDDHVCNKGEIVRALNCAVEMDPVHIFPINRDKENAVISRLFSMFSINLVQAKSSKNKGF